MASQRNKKSLKTRPKYRQVRALKNRRNKAKKAARHKRGLNRSAAKRRRRSRAK